MTDAARAAAQACRDAGGDYDECINAYHDALPWKRRVEIGRATLYEGDCLAVLAELEPESFDSCVTDPPYHLTAGKKGGTGEASVTLANPYGRARITTGFMGQKWDGGDVAFRPETWAAVLRVLKPGAHLVAFGGTRTYHRMVCAIEDAGFEVRDQLAWIFGSGFPKSHNLDGEWKGWGTALKPAYEPIVLARKPFPGTVAANVLAHGTGALNIDGCRVEMGGETVRTGQGTSDAIYGGGKGLRPSEMGTQAFTSHALGRWPANLIHDGSEEVLAGFPETASGSLRVEVQRGKFGQNGIYGTSNGSGEGRAYQADAGSAARFFYCAKADKAERGEGNNHPTVKPLALMQWLCRLVTPKGGHVLDPFAGSGSTGIAADREGFSATLIEQSAEYAEIARRRLTADAPLFAGASE